MTIKPKELEYLLTQSPKDRLDFFKKCWAAHAAIKHAAHRILSIIREPANVGVIYLIGPTGVGKSTLLRHIIKKVYEDAMPELERRPGWIPVAYMLAENPHNGVYDWTGHFIRTMEAVQEVLIERKIYLPDPCMPQAASDADLRSSRQSPRAMRSSAEKALKNRGCGVFIIDDAHFIGKRRSGEQLINQADTIKSVADQSDTLHLLAGTYDLLPLRNLNGQLGRKSVTIHFSNYKYQDDGDTAAFIGAMKYFMANMPLRNTPDFSDQWELCYALSVGCVGILKDWFVRSLDAAIMDNQGVITFDVFKSCKPPTAVSSQIADEISNGETLLKEDEDETSYAHLLECLKMKGNTPKVGKSKTVIESQDHKDESEIAPLMKASKKRSKKIKTSPHRLPIGLDNDSF